MADRVVDSGSLDGVAQDLLHTITVSSSVFFGHAHQGLSALTTLMLPLLDLSYDIDWILYCIMTFYYIRVVDTSASRHFARLHPLASLLQGFLIVHGGGAWVAFLDGQPMGVFGKDYENWTMIACWWIMFFAPFDIVFRLINNVTPLRWILICIKETNRTRKVVVGAAHGFEHAHNWSMPILYGFIKAAGGNFNQIIINLLQGSPVVSPVKPTSSAVRVSLYGAIFHAFVLQGFVHITQKESLAVITIAAIIQYFVIAWFHVDLLSYPEAFVHTLFTRWAPADKAKAVTGTVVTATGGASAAPAQVKGVKNKKND